jgi:hypothetical protein
MSPRFSIGDEVKVPAEVHSDGRAVVVSREWGPARKKPVAGWVYGVAFAFGGPAFEVKEQELEQWQ